MLKLIIVVVVTGLILITPGWLLSRWGRLRFDSQIDDEIREMEAAAERPHRGTIDLSTLDVPEPVRRYLEFAGVDGRAPVKTAELYHDGQFKTGKETPWRSIQGREFFLSEPPSFLWYGRIRMAPLLWVGARDRLFEGSGEMLVRPFGLFTATVDQSQEVLQADMLRYLSEMVWFPTALVPGDHLQWEPVDSTSARAYLKVADKTVDGVFHFSPDGQIVRFKTEGRYGSFGEDVVKQPWGGEYHDYTTVDGLQVPMRIVGRWYLPDGEFEYVRFSVTQLEFFVGSSLGDS